MIDPHKLAIARIWDILMESSPIYQCPSTKQHAQAKYVWMVRREHAFDVRRYAASHQEAIEMVSDDAIKDPAWGLYKLVRVSKRKAK